MPKDDRKLRRKANPVSGSRSKAKISKSVSAGRKSRDRKALLDRLERSELAEARATAELDFIQSDPAYRIARRLRRSALWRALKKGDRFAVRAMGMKGPHGNASEVRIRGISLEAAETPVPWDFIDFEGAWTRHEDAAAAYGACFSTTKGPSPRPPATIPKFSS